MRSLALPEYINDEPDNAEAGDDGNDRTRLGQGARLRFAGAALAECPGEGTKRGRQNRGTQRGRYSLDFKPLGATSLYWQPGLRTQRCSKSSASIRRPMS